MKKAIKKIINKIAIKKVPIYVPVYEGEILKGKTILVTGGTSGIGYSIAEASLKNGANVIITERNKEKLDNALKTLKKSTKDAKIYGIDFDISNIEMIESKVSEIVNMIGNLKIDILVNNAGVNTKEKFLNTTIDDFNNVINTNLEGTYFLSQTIANYMIKNKIEGNILFIASSSSIRPVFNTYSLSKWGIKGLVVGMAKKLVKYGITVNGIAPGPTATPMLNMSNKTDDINHNNNPIGRYVLPEEIANMAVFMMSDMGKSIIGDIVYMTGGAGTITYDDIEY
ncbi:MAG: SDR family oxidoreductase [Bacilli bacterium]|nr:SDR family oxidoreductase [Bacilli bacterium]